MSDEDDARVDSIDAADHVPCSHPTEPALGVGAGRVVFVVPPEIMSVGAGRQFPPKDLLDLGKVEVDGVLSTGGKPVPQWLIYAACHGFKSAV